MSARTKFTRNFLERIMKALIIYDNYVLAADARKNLTRAANTAGQTTRGNVEMCPVDRLKQASTAIEISRHAADAHLIVFALSRTVSLPAHVLNWLEEWAKHRQGGEAALAIFGGEHRILLSPAATDQLSRFARGNGLSLILDQEGPFRDESKPHMRITDTRDATLTPDLHEVGSGTVEESYRHWGLNE